MNLSLFIMLLAFFIVLNAISSFEEVKVKPALESIEETFSTDVRRQDIKPSVMPDPLQSIHEGDTVERLDALFQAQVRAFNSTKSTRSGVMMVEMPYTDFVDNVTTLGQRELTPQNRKNPPLKYFLPTLISLLQSDRKGVPYRMDIILHTPENPAVVQNREPQALLTAINNAGALVARLEAMGMPQKLLGIGVQKGDSANLTLVFRPHVPFSLSYEGSQPGEEGQ